jgi:EF hand
MWRFLAGVGSALLLVTAVVIMWRSPADAIQALPTAPSLADVEAPLSIADIAAPTEAGEKTREQKRFSRYDQDENGAVSQPEYLASRRKAYAKLDLNNNGTLSFDEYAVKAVVKFAKADRDHSGILTPAEFLLTRIVHNVHKTNCPRPNRVQFPMAKEPAVDAAAPAAGEED